MVQEVQSIGIDSIWPKYGLTETPYSTSPLKLFGTLPIDKIFANRVAELRELGTRIKSSGSSRTLVVGEPGVGKTTFGNYLRWMLCFQNRTLSKFVTTPVELKVQESWDSNQFLRATLASIYNASVIFEWKKNGHGIKTLGDVENYIKTTKNRSGGADFNTPVWGVGVSYGETLNLPDDVPGEVLEDFFLRVCKELRDQGTSLVIQYNNLENVNNDKLSSLLLSIRDFLQQDNLHTIFLGPPSSLAAFERHLQVRSVFGKDIFLNPLGEDQVLTILENRCKALRIPGGRYIKPYEDSTIKELYRSLNGNLRSICKILDDATMAYKDRVPCLITLKEIKAYSSQEVKSSLDDLSRNEKKIISSLMENGPMNPTEISGITKISLTNLSGKELKSLQK